MSFLQIFRKGWQKFLESYSLQPVYLGESFVPSEFTFLRAAKCLSISGTDGNNHLLYHFFPMWEVHLLSKEELKQNCHHFD